MKLIPLLEYNLHTEYDLNECIGIYTKLEDKHILFKNRDRAYKPKLEIVQEIINKVEVCYLHDTITGWKEGMNEFGIGLVNTTLMVEYDEKEGKIVDKTGKKSGQGDSIVKCLTCDNIDDVAKGIIKYKVYGHTIIADKDGNVCTVEYTSQHEPIITKHSEYPLIRTNHGLDYKDAGYTSGTSRESSLTRYKNAGKLIKDTELINNMASDLRIDKYRRNSNNNTTRKARKLFTSSQILLNLSDLELSIYIIDAAVDEFSGIVDNVDNAKIRVNIYNI